jgi:cell division septal protein FtsQ
METIYNFILRYKQLIYSFMLISVFIFILFYKIILFLIGAVFINLGIITQSFETKFASTNFLGKKKLKIR